ISMYCENVSFRIALRGDPQPMPPCQLRSLALVYWRTGQDARRAGRRGAVVESAASELRDLASFTTQPRLRAICLERAASLATPRGACAPGVVVPLASAPRSA